MRYLILVFLFIAGTKEAKAQRMAPGQKAIEFSAGSFSGELPFRNYYLQLALNTYRDGGRYLWHGLEYGHRYGYYRELAIPVESYLAEAGYSVPILRNASRSVSLNVGLAGVVGYETVNRGKKLLFDGAEISNEDTAAYGIGGRLSLEVYVCDGFVVFIQGRVKQLWGTDQDPLRFSAGAGVRINF